MRVMRDLARLGRRVPDHVSVAGFDGVQLGALTAPTLATVVQPSQQIAAAAVDLLLGILAGDRYRTPAVLHHTLRVGESIAAPPHASSPAAQAPAAAVAVPVTKPDPL